MSYEKEQARLLRLWQEVQLESEDEFGDDSSDGELDVVEEVAMNDNHEEYEDEAEVANNDGEDRNELLPDNYNCFHDKNGNKWMKQRNAKQVRTRSENIIVVLPGVKECAKLAKTHLGCWQLFFDNQMIVTIVEFTNLKIAARAQSYNADHQYMVKETDELEIKAVFGLLYLAGLYKANRQNIEDLWCADGTGIDVFRSTMSLHRFSFLVSCLRFDNINNRAERREIDKLAAIRGIFEKFTDNCKMCYTPSAYLTIDEKLEAFRGRVSFKQYIPNKPAKYGLKVYALVDSRTYYLLNMEIYVGVQPNGPYKVSNKPQDIVIRLIEPISRTNRNITFDNWFTSYELMMELLKNHKLTSVGTIRKNKRDIPTPLLNVRNRDVNSSLFAFQDDITAVSYIPKKNKNVILFSTLHHDSAIDPDTGDKMKPEMITFYNFTKGGVDTLDELSANYNVSRNSKRWPLTIFYSLLNTAGVNSQIIFKENNQVSKLKRREYLKELGMQLLSGHKSRRTENPRIPRALQKKNVNIPPETQSKRLRASKRCDFCARTKDRKTFYVCVKCNRAICMEHANFICSNCCLTEHL